MSDYIENFIYQKLEREDLEKNGIDLSEYPYATIETEWRFQDDNHNGTMDDAEKQTLQARLLDETTETIFTEWSNPFKYFLTIPDEVYEHFQTQRLHEGEEIGDSELEEKQSPCFSMGPQMATHVMTAIEFALSSGAALAIDGEDIYHGHLSVSPEFYNTNLSLLSWHKKIELINEHPEAVTVLLHSQEYTGVPNKDRKTTIKNGDGEPYNVKSRIEYDSKYGKTHWRVIQNSDINKRHVAGIFFELSENGNYQLSDGRRINIWYHHRFS